MTIRNMPEMLITPPRRLGPQQPVSWWTLHPEREGFTQFALAHLTPESQSMAGVGTQHLQQHRETWR